MPDMILVTPAPEHLASYAEALRRGASPSSTRPELAHEHLDAIATDPAAFLASEDDPEGKGPPVTLADGRQVPRLPVIARWMWDGAYAGSIGLRWQPGTPELPPHVLGHIGYGVVPWRRRMGYATRALALILPEAAQRGLPQVDLTIDPGNHASRRVVEANGGVLVERFATGPEHGHIEMLRFRIHL
jgi:predicted acetyltransferase